MPENKINLEEIIENHRNNTDHWADQDFDEYCIEQICLEFGKQLLELASENAEVNSISTSDDSSGFIHEVDKQSILDTINQVE